MVSCAIYGCSSHSSRQTELSYHKLPSGKFPAILAAWLDVIAERRPESREDHEKGKKLYVCSKHFLDDDYEKSVVLRMAYLPEHRPKRNLKKVAVPSRNLNLEPNIRKKRIVPAAHDRPSTLKWKQAHYPVPYTTIQDDDDDDGDESPPKKRRNKDIERLEGEGFFVIDDSADVYWKPPKKPKEFLDLPSTPFRPLKIVRKNPPKSCEPQDPSQSLCPPHFKRPVEQRVLVAQNSARISNHALIQRNLALPRNISTTAASSNGASPILVSANTLSPIIAHEVPAEPSKLPPDTRLPPTKLTVRAATQCDMGKETYKNTLERCCCDFSPQNRQIWVKPWSDLIDSAEHRLTCSSDAMPVSKKDVDVQCDIGKEFYAKYALSPYSEIDFFENEDTKFFLHE